MITGDNINTAISISKTCGIVDTDLEDITMCTYDDNSNKLRYNLLNIIGDPTGEINPDTRKADEKRIIGAMDDINFQKIVKEQSLELNKPINLKSSPVLSEIAKNVRVFARMNPSQKGLIVKIFKEYYKKDKYAVGFCGDGANDCIALKHADIGVSLSQNESSLSAPFVSKVQEISCIEQVSIIGKAALTTNFDCFRYFCLYSIIQTIGLVILLNQKTEYSIPMYLTMDVAIALNVANCIGLIAPVKELTSKLPKYTLIKVKFMISLAVNGLFSLAAMFFGLVLIRQDSNFVSSKKIAS